LTRLGNILFLLLFVSVLAGGPQLLNTDGDLPRHLLMGKYVLEIGAAPTIENFAYPYAGREYIPHEWLAGVIFYLAYLAFDLNGVVLLAGILIGATFIIISMRASANSKEPLLSFMLVLLGAVATSIHWLARPHLFTMAFLALWLTWLDRLNRGETVRLWAFPALMLFWANMHAEYIIGFLVSLGYLTGSIWTYSFSGDVSALSKAKTLSGILFLSFGASLLNPSGLKAWTTIAAYVNNRYLMSRIAETRPPDLLSPESVPLLLLLAICLILVAGNKQKYQPADIFLLTGFGVMSLISARNVHLFGAAAPLILSHGLNGIQIPPSLKNVGTLFARMESPSRRVILPIAATIILGAILLAFPLKNYNRFDPKIFPVDAVQWLKENPRSGRMFNAFDWGGYLLFHLWPSQQVFIESQTDTNGELTRIYESVIIGEPGWQDVFSGYEIEWAILPPDWAITEELQNEGWVVAYEDDTAAILVNR
jgi:hypothetical protein